MSAVPPSEFLTFVFRITDEEAARSTIDPLMAAFRGEASLPGIEVTGVSLEDEMTLADSAGAGRYILERSIFSLLTPDQEVELSAWTREQRLSPGEPVNCMKWPGWREVFLARLASFGGSESNK